jgi:hypothetical protein
MHIKHVCCAALVSTAFVWAGAAPATAQLFGFNPGATQTPAGAQPEAAPGKPMVLKKYTKRRSRSSRHKKKAEHAATAAPDKPADTRQAKNGKAAETSKATAPDLKQATAETGAVDTAGSNDKTAPIPSAAPRPTPAWAAIPSSVANARAELDGGKADTRAAFAAPSAATPAPAALTPPPAPQAADTTVAPGSSAQVADSTAAAAGPALASADTAAPIRLMSATIQNERVAAASDTTWSRTSLIGKIFVAFGGLLMLASAARLYFG